MVSAVAGNSIARTVLCVNVLECVAPVRLLLDRRRAFINHPLFGNLVEFRRADAAAVTREERSLIASMLIKVGSDFDGSSRNAGGRATLRIRGRCDLVGDLADTLDPIGFTLSS